MSNSTATSDPVALHLATLAPSTRRVVAGDLRLAAALAPVPFPSLTTDQAAALREAIAARWAPGTANRTLSGIRGVLRAAWRNGGLSWEAHVRLLASLPVVRGGRVTRGRSLTWPDVCRLLDTEPPGSERRALLAVLAGAGLRRAEAAGLTWSRATRHDRTWHLRVLGKGNRERRLRLPAWAARDLEMWRRRCPEREPVFRWRSGASIHGVVAGAARRAGLGPLAPHDLRRTYFALARSSGMDLSTIRRTMGHASVATTVKYDRRSDDELDVEAAQMDALDTNPPNT